MLRMVCVVVLLLLLSTLLLTVTDAASVTVHIPAASQYPPPPRVGVNFFFRLHPHSYLSSDPLVPVRVQVASMPAWMAFDTASLTFSGRPQGPVSAHYRVVITADAPEQASGALATPVQDFLDLVVIADVPPPPRLSTPVIQQLQTRSGQLSPPNAPVIRVDDASSALLLPTQTSFSFAVSQDTFIAGDNVTRLRYFAFDEDDFAFPSWVSFDSSRNTFAGQTPSTPTYLRIVLVASDGAGGSVNPGGPIDQFSVKVGNTPPVAKSQTLPPLNVAKGGAINWDIPADTFTDADGDRLQLEVALMPDQFPGQPATAAVGKSSLSWLQVDRVRGALIGSPPMSVNLLLSATDPLNRTAVTMLPIVVDNQPAPLSSNRCFSPSNLSALQPCENLTAIYATSWTYVLPSDLFNSTAGGSNNWHYAIRAVSAQKAGSATAAATAAAAVNDDGWLSYDSDKHALIGIPSAYDPLFVAVIATNAQNASAMAMLRIDVVQYGSAYSTVITTMSIIGGVTMLIAIMALFLYYKPHQRWKRQSKLKFSDSRGSKEPPWPSLNRITYTKQMQDSLPGGALSPTHPPPALNRSAASSTSSSPTVSSMSLVQHAASIPKSNTLQQNVRRASDASMITKGSVRYDGGTLVKSADAVQVSDTTPAATINSQQASAAADKAQHRLSHASVVVVGEEEVESTRHSDEIVEVLEQESLCVDATDTEARLAQGAAAAAAEPRSVASSRNKPLPAALHISEPPAAAVNALAAALAGPTLANGSGLHLPLNLTADSSASILLDQSKLSMLSDNYKSLLTYCITAASAVSPRTDKFDTSALDRSSRSMLASSSSMPGSNSSEPASSPTTAAAAAAAAAIAAQMQLNPSLSQYIQDAPGEKIARYVSYCQEHGQSFEASILGISMMSLSRSASSGTAQQQQQSDARSKEVSALAKLLARKSHMSAKSYATSVPTTMGDMTAPSSPSSVHSAEAAVLEAPSQQQSPQHEPEAAEHKDRNIHQLSISPNHMLPASFAHGPGEVASPMTPGHHMLRELMRENEAGDSGKRNTPSPTGPVSSRAPSSRSRTAGAHGHGGTNGRRVSLLRATEGGFDGEGGLANNSFDSSSTTAPFTTASVSLHRTDTMATHSTMYSARTRPLSFGDEEDDDEDGSDSGSSSSSSSSSRRSASHAGYAETSMISGFNVTAMSLDRGRPERTTLERTQPEQNEAVHTRRSTLPLVIPPPIRRLHAYVGAAFQYVLTLPPHLLQQRVWTEIYFSDHPTGGDVVPSPSQPASAQHSSFSPSSVRRHLAAVTPDISVADTTASSDSGVPRIKRFVVASPEASTSRMTQSNQQVLSSLGISDSMLTLSPSVADTPAVLDPAAATFGPDGPASPSLVAASASPSHHQDRRSVRKSSGRQNVQPWIDVSIDASRSSGSLRGVPADDHVGDWTVLVYHSVDVDHASVQHVEIWRGVITVQLADN
ncbi:hypothetical protein RI367_002018 [Sorochytrium milnesiophthora]